MPNPHKGLRWDDIICRQEQHRFSWLNLYAQPPATDDRTCPQPLPPGPGLFALPQVPTAYYLLCLGQYLKYSSCLYLSPKDSLTQAEYNMLGACRRACRLHVDRPDPSRTSRV